MAYLYRHIRLDINEPFYIGIGSDSDNYRRAHEKSRRNIHWKRIIDKSSYEIEIIMDDLTWKNACEKEKEFISLYGRVDLNNGTLCNHTDGGEGLYNPSEETRNKKRLSMIGKNKGENNGMKKPESRLKASLSRMGKYKGSNHPRSISIICYDTKGLIVKEYDSILGAEKETGIPNTNITKVCKGKRKSAGGYIWKYKNKKNHGRI
jgi:hypothetical protein